MLRTVTGAIRTCHLAGIIKNTNYTINNGIRAASTIPLPAPPSPPVPVLDLPELIFKEPSFVDLGLGGWWPSGMVQSSLEYLHVNLDLPWWTAIVIGTICVRTVVFPAVIITQRNNSKMTNLAPEMNELQNKIGQAKKRGDQLEAAKCSMQLMSFMKIHNINPIMNAIAPMIQFPFFLSFFVGLRGMANCPVESLINGGLFWFTDLTLPDQFYLLPILTSITLFINIELGIDSVKITKKDSLAKYALRSIPIVMLPFTIHFPAAILCYWFSSNTVSLFQGILLRIPYIRTKFNIPKIVNRPQSSETREKKGFVTSLKDIYSDTKITKEVENRLRMDERAFNNAGKGPLVKTYKYDPTKVIKMKSS